MAGDYVVPEARWQQVYRENSVGYTWQSEWADAAGSLPLRSAVHPGTNPDTEEVHWFESELFVQYNMQVFNLALAHNIDRGDDGKAYSTIWDTIDPSYETLASWTDGVSPGYVKTKPGAHYLVSVDTSDDGEWISRNPSKLKPLPPPESSSSSSL